MFTFSNTFWSQSVFAEVSHFKYIFVALTFYLILSLKNTIGLYVFSLIYGIGLANHNTLMLLGANLYIIHNISYKNSVFKTEKFYNFIIFGFSWNVFLFLSSNTLTCKPSCRLGKSRKF